jgi:hypothetical protein
MNLTERLSMKLTEHRSKEALDDSYFYQSGGAE